MTRRFHTAIVIPARNEERRIEACLAALMPQIGDDTLLVLVANNSNDATAARARMAVPATALRIIRGEFPANRGAGSARRLGCAAALRAVPDLEWLMTTDADCAVAPDWVERNLDHLTVLDAVCGAVVPITDESGNLANMPAEQGQNEADYRRLVQLFHAGVYPEAHNPLPHHGEAPGASLAFRAAAYRQAGGFSHLRRGEDRDLIRRMRAAGLRVGHAGAVPAAVRIPGRSRRAAPTRFPA